jgi:protein-tyrosine-phosphatase
MPVGGEMPASVLFACTMNAVRSPMAEGILKHLAGHRIRVASAGVRAGQPDPFAIAVMDEIGIDISDHEPRRFSAIGDEVYELIVTLSPEAHHHAVELTRIMPARVEYWPTLDATVPLAGGTREQTAARYRRVRDELFSKIKARFGIDAPLI